MALCEIYSAIECDLTRFFQLTLVPDEIYANIFSRVGFNFLQPFCQADECLITSDIVSQKNLVCTTVEDSGHRFERFLSGLVNVSFHILVKKTYSVPNLELDNFVRNFESVRTEFNTYGDLVLCFKFVVHNTLHQT